jgi:hypothetical protein
MGFDAGSRFLCNPLVLMENEMKRGRKPSFERYDLINKDGRVIKRMKTLGGALKAAKRLDCRIEKVDLDAERVFNFAMGYAH